MRWLALLFALAVGSAQAFPLSCWTNRPDTVVTVIGYQGASARISVPFALWDGPLGERTLQLSAPTAAVSVSEIAIRCKSPLADVPGLAAVKDEQGMFLSPTAKIPVGYSLPVKVWIDEPLPGYRRATIGGKP